MELSEEMENEQVAPGMMSVFEAERLAAEKGLIQYFSFTSGAELHTRTETFNDDKVLTQTDQELNEAVKLI